MREIRATTRSLDRLCPLWVAHVDVGDTAEKAKQRVKSKDEKWDRIGFYPDPNLVTFSTARHLPYVLDASYSNPNPPEFPGVEGTPTHSTRGHNASNDEMKLEGGEDQGVEAQRESFSLANVSPRTQHNNAPLWTGPGSRLPDLGGQTRARGGDHRPGLRARSQPPVTAERAHYNSIPVAHRQKQLVGAQQARHGLRCIPAQCRRAPGEFVPAGFTELHGLPPGHSLEHARRALRDGPGCRRELPGGHVDVPDCYMCEGRVGDDEPLRPLRRMRSQIGRSSEDNTAASYGCNRPFPAAEIAAAIVFGVESTTGKLPPRIRSIP